jgi:hypothetical protein
MAIKTRLEWGFLVFYIVMFIGLCVTIPYSVILDEWTDKERIALGLSPLMAGVLVGLIGGAMIWSDGPAWLVKPFR